MNQRFVHSCVLGNVIQQEKAQAINLSLWKTVWLFILFNYVSKPTCAAINNIRQQWREQHRKLTVTCPSHPFHFNLHKNVGFSMLSDIRDCDISGSKWNTAACWLRGYRRWQDCINMMHVLLLRDQQFPKFGARYTHTVAPEHVWKCGASTKD